MEARTRMDANAPLKILYAAGLSPNDSSLYRLWALERLGHQVVRLNAYEYVPRNPLVVVEIAFEFIS